MEVQLSVVMITQNAERLLELVLQKAAQVADEIIIVDSGSTDKTLEIAQKFSAKVVQQDWLGFGLQKQKALELAVGDWVLALDADEVLTDEFIASLKALKDRHFDVPYSAYEIKRPLVFAGKILRRSISLWTTRLFKRDKARFTDQIVHERLIIDGPVGRISQGEVLHYSYASVGDWLSRMQRYIDLSAQEKRKTQKSSVSFAVLSGISVFFKIYVLKAGFLEGRIGFVIAMNWAISNYLKYLMLALDDEFKVKE